LESFIFWGASGSAASGRATALVSHVALEISLSRIRFSSIGIFATLENVKEIGRKSYRLDSRESLN
jgi:hypothetical protein